MGGLISSSSRQKKESNQANNSQAFEIRDTLLPSCGLIPTLQCVTQLFSITAGIYMVIYKYGVCVSVFNICMYMKS